MTRILSVRLHRRAIGIAILEREGLTFADGRHLASGVARAIPTAVAYVQRWLTGSGATAVIVDSAPAGLSEVTDDIRAHVAQLCADAHLPMLTIGRAEILAAYGHPALRSRYEVRGLVGEYWPDLLTIRGRVRPFAIDAAAAALYAECRMALYHPT